MFLAGGCFETERIILHQGGTKMDVAVLYLILAVTVNISCLILFVFYSKLKVLTNKRLTIFFSKLLI